MSPSKKQQKMKKRNERKRAAEAKRKAKAQKKSMKAGSKGAPKQKLSQPAQAVEEVGKALVKVGTQVDKKIKERKKEREAERKAKEQADRDARNLINKFNSRIRKIEDDPNVTEESLTYLRENLQKAGIELTKQGNIKNTQHNRALQSYLDSYLPKDAEDVPDFVSFLNEEVKYREEHFKKAEEGMFLHRFKQKQREAFEDLLLEYYDGLDKKTRGKNEKILLLGEDSLDASDAWDVMHDIGLAYAQGRASTEDIRNSVKDLKDIIYKEKENE